MRQWISTDDGGFLVAVKDNIDIEGLTTGMGSAAFVDAAPALANATVVDLLIAGRCRIIGKARMHEMAFGVTGINDWQGTPENPLYPHLVPGGSSSGSAAAVAAGLCDFAIGTDTGGSIRVPAACCGVIGFKPSFDLVPHRGVHPGISSLDCVGVFARTMPMIRSAMAILAPKSADEWRRTAAPNALVVGLVQCDAEPAINAGITHALACNGWLTRPIILPSFGAAFDAAALLMAAEVWQTFGSASIDVAALGSDIRARFAAAQAITAVEIETARSVRARFAAEVDEALANVDCLALPTLLRAVPTINEARNAANMLWLTALVRPFNLSGHPAISLPLNSCLAAPSSLQLVGRRMKDSTLCAIASTFIGQILELEGLSL